MQNKDLSPGPASCLGAGDSFDLKELLPCLLLYHRSRICRPCPPKHVVFSGRLVPGAVWGMSCVSPKTSVSRPTGDSNLILDQWKLHQDNLLLHTQGHHPLLHSLPALSLCPVGCRQHRGRQKLSMRGWRPSLPLVQRASLAWIFYR